MMEFVENSMLLGSPFPKGEPEDISDYRNRLSDGCGHMVDGVCCFDPEDWSTTCVGMEVCPDARW